MSEIQIIPAHDERVLCKFTLPIKGRKPLKWQVPRLQFLDVTEAFEAWTRQTLASKKQAVSLDGTPLVDEKGDPVKEPVKNREVTLKMLELAEVPAATLEVLAGQPDGVLDQIWKHWTEASAVDLGESEASDAS